MNRTFALLASLSLVFLLPAASAFELNKQQGYGDSRLGDPINQTGTRRTASSPPVELRVNLLRCDDANLDGGVESASDLPSADLSRLSQLVDASGRYWEQVPSSFIQVRLGGSDRTATYVNLRPFILVTLGTTPSGVAGAAWGTVSGGQYLPMGIIINIAYFRAVSDATIRDTIVHEIGHSLSVAHSSCDRCLTQNARFGFTDSLGAFMSYGDATGRAVLHTDDVAAIALGYPEPSATTEFGTIAGELVDAAGSAIFGGNVFAVNSANLAVVSRISGLTDFSSLTTKHGKFRISGLAPGTYTLVGASVADSTYRIGSRPSMPYSSYYQTGFAPAVRTQVQVYAGQTTDVGRLTAGTDGSSSGTLVQWAAVAGATSYRFYIYSYTEGRWVVYGQLVPTNSVRVPLRDGRYWLLAYGYASGYWRLAESRIFRVGDALSRPPVVTALSSVEGIAGRALSIKYSAADPYGGPLQIRVEGMPAGMIRYSNQLYWAAPAVGTWTIRIVATNEAGVTGSASIALSVREPRSYPVTIRWSRQSNDVSYGVRIYSYDLRQWVALATTTQNEFRQDLVEGTHYVFVYRTLSYTYVYYGRTYTYYYTRTVGWKVFNQSAETTIQFP
ncbi:MAG: hypothetical protein HY720_08610 [Planctomycetes bacterium]|nr:hypothetical protein [Planctomycetota bacterium]